MPTPADRWRQAVRVSNRVEAWQLRVLGTSGVALLRRRTVLLLETVGRRTGKRRRAPVTYFADDGGFVIGGGAGGMTKVDWVANLRHHPTARVWVRRRRFDVTVTELVGADRDAAHARAQHRFPEIEKYERVSGRTIPYFRLSP
ncbi:MAG: nitroreductase family deazaflavin-dependent oxidoreductase [Actinobacteria bacterium]|nr:nitroreductase family deazaflavin-dependent oxidoreductase [Actinomycetota bacterium]